MERVTLSINNKSISYQIEYDVDKIHGTAEFVELHTDYIFPKLLVSLLRDSADKLKSYNITSVFINTTIEDYEDFKDKGVRWEVIEKTNYIRLKCNIDDFSRNMVIGWGIQV